VGKAVAGRGEGWGGDVKKAGGRWDRKGGRGGAMWRGEGEVGVGEGVGREKGGGEGEGG